MRTSILLASAMATASMASPLSFLWKKDLAVALPASLAGTYEGLPIAPEIDDEVDVEDLEKRAGQKPDATTYQGAVIRHHNYHRRNHSAPLITWNQNLANIAMEIAQNCVYAHNVTAGGGGYGQNIAAGYSAGMISNTITTLFYNNEEPNFPQYGNNNIPMSGFGGWGHFSQIVWKATTEVGCATWQCPSLQNIPSNSGIAPIMTVCNYSPPGNYLGEWGDQIGAPLGHPTILGNKKVNEAAVLASYNQQTGQNEQ